MSELTQAKTAAREASSAAAEENGVAAGETAAGLRKYKDTVEGDTPARPATSAMVTRCIFRRVRKV